jgi:hypothetical protein
MSLMGDHQTGSYWDHITGECLHGPLKGRQLTLAPLRHMRADQALAQFPDARIARSRLLLPFGMIDGVMKLLQRLGKGRFLPPGFAGSMGEEDPRRPRLDMGLGVWSGRVSRYYPLDLLKARAGVLIDRFDDRMILVYLDPVSGTPTPLFADVQQAEWDGDELRMDSGATIRNGKLYDAYHAELPVAQPLHLFSRWYGFSLTFPKCEIYGDADE